MITRRQLIVAATLANGIECGNYQLYGAGSCSAMGGKLVSTTGWCIARVKQA